MIRLTKIFHFEMAHAIHGYPGSCKNIHGHSYELHVTVTRNATYKNAIPGTGLLIDFKDIKKIVCNTIIEKFDHKVVLSQAYLQANGSFSNNENLVSWQMEPTAENMLLFIKQQLEEALPAGIRLLYLKLFETKDSYAEWLPANTFAPY